jgi:C-terminal processing protease CtpA/Prc
MALTSCGEDRSGEFYELIEDKLWIEQVMREHYLWYEDIPSIENENDYFKEPEAFFKSLLSKNALNGKGDIYSHMEEIPAAEAAKSRSVNWTSTYGMEYYIYNDPTQSTNHKFARVLYVLYGSPAHQAGIQRGDWISTINQERITNSNAEKLVKGGAIQLTRNHLAQQGNKLVWQSVDTLQVEASAPIDFQSFYISAIYNYEMLNKKIAYVLYNRFETGAENDPEDTTYSDQLKELFAEIKKENPDDFILDLRYNNGGYLQCAQALAAMLMPAEHLGKPLFHLTFNDKQDPQVATYVAPTDLEPYNLNLQRIYILTGPHTASASEAIINALTPYMGKENVIVIGTQTEGKNVAMTNIKNDTYGLSLWPVVAQVSNANNESDYINGFTPDYFLDERNIVEWNELGNPSEYLLGNTLSLINTGTITQSNTLKTISACPVKTSIPAKGILIH